MMGFEDRLAKQDLRQTPCLRQAGLRLERSAPQTPACGRQEVLLKRSDHWLVSLDTKSSKNLSASTPRHTSVFSPSSTSAVWP